MAPPSTCGACAILLALVSGAAAAPRDGAASSARASRSAAPVVQPRASDAFSPRSAARLPTGGETSPGSPDPISVPFRATATFHPAYAGAYGAPGPHAPAVTTRAFDLSLGDRARYGFGRVVASFPFDHELPADAGFRVGLGTPYTKLLLQIHYLLPRRAVATAANETGGGETGGGETGGGGGGGTGGG